MNDGNMSEQIAGSTHQRADNGFDYEAAVRGYLAAARWSSVDPESESGRMLDEVEDKYGSPLEWSARAENTAMEIIEEFIGMVLAEDLAAYLVRFDEHSLGHDLWLTAAGHGAGFWDRGLGAAGARLTAYAKLFPMDAYHHKDLLELQ